MSKDPIRLAERGDVPELSELMQAAQSRLPDAARLEAMLARVEAAAAPAATTATNAVGAKVIGAKAIGALAALGAGGVAAWLALAPAAVPSTPPAAAPTRASSTVSAARAPAPVEAPPVPSQAPEAEIKPRKAHAASPVPSSTGPSELELIRDARQALASDPARALVLTQQHARAFPGGALGQEREVIAIEALTKLGQTSAARARALKFMAANPSSAYVLRLERSVGALRSDSKEPSEKNLVPDQKE